MPRSTFWLPSLTAVILSTAVFAQEPQKPSAGKKGARAHIASKRHYEIGSKAIMKVVSPVAPEVSRSTVTIVRGRRKLALGLIVTPDGHVLTKAGSLREGCQVVIAGQRRDASVIGIHAGTDLAMLKIDAADLPVAKLAKVDPENFEQGRWLISAGPEKDPIAVGVASGHPGQPRPSIGVMMSDIPPERNGMAGVSLTMIVPGSPAHREDLRVNDVILSIDGQEVDSIAAIRSFLASKQPYDQVQLLVDRGGVEMKIPLVLGERQSQPKERRRRKYFEHAIGHDTKIPANRCGGPVIDLNGQIVGINVLEPWRDARAGIAENSNTNLALAIPVNHVIEVVDKLLSGELEPNRLNQAQIESLSQEAIQIRKTLAEYHVQRESIATSLKEIQSQMEELLKRQVELEKPYATVTSDSKRLINQLRKIESKLKRLRQGVW